MEIIDLGKTPISTDLPSGEDVRYEPEYEELQTEIEKLSSPTSQGATDWDKVVGLATTILGEKSKDLLVASYLFVGLLQSQGLEALAPGMNMYRGLITGFWDSLFPLKKRMRARKNALEWWLDKMLGVLNALPKGSTVAKETKRALLEDVEALDDFLRENMEDAPPLHQLIGALNSLTVPGEPRPEKQQEPELESEPSPRAYAQAPAAPKAEDVETPESQDPQKILRQGLDIVRNAASLYRGKDPSNATPYRMSRIAAWLGVEMLPPAQDGKTRIPPPMEQVKSALDNLDSQGNFKELLEYAESRVGQFLFWLDLSRYVAEALEQLGYDEALDVVSEETAQYARRLKGIEKLAFSDGTPFADEATQGWIEDITENKAAGKAPDFPPLTNTASDGEEARIAETYAQAQALLKEKKLFEALDLSQKDLNGAGSERSRLLRRMNMARLLINAKKPRLALPHLLEILEDIDRHGLESWNPDLALEALIQVYSGLRIQRDKEFQERAVTVLDRIARLNPAAAIRIEG